MWGAHEGSLLLWSLIPERLDARRRGAKPEPAARGLRPGTRGPRLHRGGLSVLHAVHLEPVSPVSFPPRSRDGTSTPCFRTSASSSIPPSSTWATWGSRFRSRSRSRLSRRGGSTRPGPAGPAPGRPSPGPFSPSASRAEAGGPTTSSDGVGGGSGTPWRTLPSSVARRHRPHPLARRRGEARYVQGLDRAARDLGFSLSLLGTFIVRSGVLVSVHAFANDPERGVFILAFLGLGRRRRRSRSTHGGPDGWRGAGASRSFRARRCSSPTTYCSPPPRPPSSSAPSIRCSWIASPRADLGRPPLLRPYIRPPHGPPLAGLVALGMLARWKRDRAARLAPLLGVVLAAAAREASPPPFSRTRRRRRSGRASRSGSPARPSDRSWKGCEGRAICSACRAGSWG